MRSQYAMQLYHRSACTPYICTIWRTVEKPNIPTGLDCPQMEYLIIDSETLGPALVCPLSNYDSQKGYC